MSENPGRERILQRIQSALQNPAPLRHAYSGGPIFEEVGDPLARFQEQCKANLTECMAVKDGREVSLAAGEIVAGLPPGDIFVQDAPLLRRMMNQIVSDRKVYWSGSSHPTETCQATITLTECLVAATGSVFVSSDCGGRAASIVAPVHIVVATAGQVVPTLEAAFQWMHSNGVTERSSMMSLISGPSRTGDIEKIIVMGAHGPRRLVVLLMLNG